MTGDQIVQIINAVIPAVLAFLTFLGILVTGILAYKTNRKVVEVKKETAEQTANINATAVIAAQSIRKSDEIITKTNEIHTLTNSNLSKVTAALEMVQVEFRSLKESSAAEIRALETTIARLIGDKKTAEGVAARLAERAESKPSPVPQRTLTDASVKLKEDIIIEGTLETKE